MNVSARTAFAATALAVALAITGCTTTGGVPAPAPTATTSATATPVAAKVGDTIADGVELAEGQHAFPMPDGTAVLVENDQPLPVTVQAVVQGAVDAAVVEYPPVDGGGTTIGSLALQLAGRYEVQTGKKSLVIVPGFGSIGDNGPTQVVWGVIGAQQSFYQKAAAVAFAQAYISQQPNPAEWMVVISG